MQFEDFDSKVRQAADQHHPNYDENAWAKMQKLLDQQLPVKKDRDRRFIFLLLFFLLLGGGAWVIFSKPWQQENKIVSISKDPDKAMANAADATPENGVNKQDISKSPVDKSQGGETVSKQPQENSTDNKTNDVSGNKDQLKAPAPIVKHNGEGEGKQTLNVPTNRKVNNASSKQTKAVTAKNNRNVQTTVAISAPQNTGKETKVDPGNQGATLPKNSDSNPKSSDALANIDDVKTQTNADHSGNNEPKNKNVEEKKENVDEHAVVEKKQATKKNPGSKKSNYFFLTFGVAPDLSYISLSDPGQVKLLSGAGFGYTFHNRWTISTGFYAGRKIYTANKYNYKPDNPGPTNNLEKIDADCKVYEVPLSIAYNFINAQKHSFFGSLGLSSLFMKKEEYQYLYKYPGPPPTTYVHTKELYNENQHYFSVLTLSAGYTRRLNKTFSISAEPYVKLPLAGIGYGHVKLNSMGVLFSINVAPFHH